jgi:hypothetical protein
VFSTSVRGDELQHRTCGRRTVKSRGCQATQLVLYACDDGLLATMFASF